MDVLRVWLGVKLEAVGLIGLKPPEETQRLQRGFEAERHPRGQTRLHGDRQEGLGRGVGG